MLPGSGNNFGGFRKEEALLVITGFLKHQSPLRSRVSSLSNLLVFLFSAGKCSWLIGAAIIII
jgi:hypothetical protein